jgi:hypothetical protein
MSLTSTNMRDGEGEETNGRNTTVTRFEALDDRR